MLKKELRTLYRKQRKEITAAQRLKWDDLLLIQFQQLALPPLNNLLSFYPIEANNEIDTFIITDYLKFTNPGLQVAYPKTDLATGTMQAIIEDEETVFEENRYFIPEPVYGEQLPAEDIEVVLIPLMAFDKRGNRVGYGKGFYDRFLESCSPHCIKIGLSYFEAVDTIDDADEFDVPLNFCITPQMIYVF